MNKLIILILVIFLSSFAFADLTDGLYGWYDFNSNGDDAKGSNDATINGATSHTGANPLDDYYDCEIAGSEYISIPAINGQGIQSIGVWFRVTLGQTASYVLGTGDTVTNGGGYSGTFGGGGDINKFYGYFKDTGGVVSTGATTSKYDGNGWHLAMYVLDDDADTLYITIDDTDTVSMNWDLSELGSTEELTLCKGIDGGTPSYQNQDTTKVALWTEELSSADQTAYYNSGNSLEYSDLASAPTTPTWVYPINAITYNNTATVIDWTIDGTCDYSQVWRNTTLVYNNTATEFTTFFNEGHYGYKVSCFNTSSETHSANTSSKTIVFDATDPTITWNVPSVFYTITKDQLSLDIDLFDLNLWSGYVNISLTGSTVYYENVSGLGSTFTFNGSTNLSSDGNHTIQVEGCDQHTESTWLDKPEKVSKNVGNKNILFEFSDGSDITIEQISSDTMLIGLGTYEENDRWQFRYINDDTGRITYKSRYRIESDKPIVYLPNSPYNLHFIINNEYWIDFENPNIIKSKFEGKTTSNGKYYIEVTIESTEANMLFESIGGLNCHDETYYIYYDTTPPTIGAYVNQSLYTYQSLSYGFTATDVNSEFTWGINETTNFTINANTGVISNTDTLIAGTFHFNVSVNDTVDNTAQIVFELNVTVIPPSIIDNVSFYALDSNLNILGNKTYFNTENLTAIEYMMMNFTVVDHDGINYVDLYYTANGTNGCTLGNRQNFKCYNYSNFIHYNQSGTTPTFKDDGVIGDYINQTFTGNSTHRTYTIIFDEHYNPNVYKDYSADYNFSDIKWQTGTSQRITGNNYIKVDLESQIIPLTFDQAKLDFRVQTTLLPDGLEAWLCNTTYTTGDVTINDNCVLVATKNPVQIINEKFRAIITQELVQTLNNIDSLVLRTNEPNPNRYYSLKTYGFLNVTHNEEWSYSTNAGTSYTSGSDGYENEVNLNWFNDGLAPTQFIIKPSIYDDLGIVTNITEYKYAWDINATFNYPPLVTLLNPLDQSSQISSINVTWDAVDGNNDEFNSTLLIYNTTHQFNYGVFDNATFSHVADISSLIDGDYFVSIVVQEMNTPDLYEVNDTHEISIQKLTSDVDLYIDGSRAITSVTQNSIVSFNVTLATGEFGTLTLNEDDFTLASNTTGNVYFQKNYTAVGSHLICGNYSGNANYTGSSECFTLTVTLEPTSGTADEITIIQDEIPYFKTGQPSNYVYSCEESNVACDSDTMCQLTAFYPHQEVFVDSGVMTYNDVYFNYTLPSTREVGLYKVIITCVNPLFSKYDTKYFIVNETGTKGGILLMNIFYIFLKIAFFIFLIILCVNAILKVKKADKTPYLLVALLRSLSAGASYGILFISPLIALFLFHPNFSIGIMQSLTLVSYIVILIALSPVILLNILYFTSNIIFKFGGLEHDSPRTNKVLNDLSKFTGNIDDSVNTFKNKMFRR